MKILELLRNFTMETFQGISEINGDIVISPFSIYYMIHSIALGKNPGEDFYLIKNQVENNSFKSKHILLHKPSFCNKAFLDYFDTSISLEETKLKLIKNQQNKNFLDRKLYYETNGIIKKATPYLDPKFDLILLNSVDFNLQWQHKFNIKYTKGMGFHINGILKSVPTMSLSKQVYVTKSVGYKAAIIPFEDDFAFIGVLPNKSKDLSNIHKKLSKKDRLNKLTKKCWLQTVTLRIPKFTITSEVNITENLKDLGLKSLKSMNFVNGSNINKVKIIHKTKFGINELGTDDSDCTEGFAGYCSANIDEESNMIFNRPFLFYIVKKIEIGKDETSLIPLVTGKYDGTNEKKTFDY